jgi:hypothetical protein
VLLKASLEILLHLFLLVCDQNFVWVLGKIGFGVHISDAYVNYAICSMGPETVNQHVSLIFTSVLMKVAHKQVFFWFRVVLLF